RTETVSTIKGQGPTTIMEIMKLETPQSGSIRIDGEEVSRLSRAEKLELRSQMAMVFQDPMASLDPRMPIGDILREPMEVQGYSDAEMAKRVDWLLRTVGLLPEQSDRYPQVLRWATAAHRHRPSARLRPAAGRAR
ncbi:ATP-binding cassette domain-containing protein, partial [Gulosibacter macacae]|uniref:ATP-binding cassette domain-containing protein n=1 Tax=Gulosibacter macacae TaxID=2488791 RepID=UPI0038B2759C